MIQAKKLAMAPLLLVASLTLAGCSLSLTDGQGSTSEGNESASVESQPADTSAPTSDTDDITFITAFGEVQSFAYEGQAVAVDELGLLTGKYSSQIGIVEPAILNLDQITARFFIGNMSSSVSYNLPKVDFVLGGDYIEGKFDKSCDVPREPGTSLVCTATFMLSDGKAPLVAEGYFNVETPDKAWVLSYTAFPAWETQAPQSSSLPTAGTIVPWDWNLEAPLR